MQDLRCLPCYFFLVTLLTAGGCEAFLTHRGGEGEPCFKDGASPCAEGLECNPDGICVTASGCQEDQDCDDGISCTQDNCNSGSCQHLADDSTCDDNFCTGEETCDLELGCQSSGNPCSGGGSCDEQLSACCQLPSGGFSEGRAVSLGTGDTSMFWGLLSRDFNADGILDLAVLRRTKNQVAILLGNGSAGHGDGTFTFAQNYPTGSSPYDLVSGDFNSDGITDLAVASSTDNYVYVSLGDGAGGKGNGEFPSATPFSVGKKQVAIEAADFDSDGILDLALACTDPQNTGDVRVLLGGGQDGRGNGTFNYSATYAMTDTTYTTSKPNDLVAADFTGDGILDLAVADGDNDLVRVLPGTGNDGHGDGGFDTGNAIVTTGLDATPIALATGDFDRDGIMDLAVAAYDGDKVDVLLGNGDGSFSWGPSILTGSLSKPRDVVIADFDSDGILDLAIANSTDTGSDRNKVLVVRGTGGGNFSAPQQYYSAQSPRALAAGDFDEDGDTDLAVVNWASDDLRIFLGENPGSRADMTYDVRVDYSPCQGSTDAHGLALAHFNKDAINDVALAATCNGNAGAYILAGQGSNGRGNGTLQVDGGTTIVTGVNENNGPTDLVAADFNNDSLTDLAVTTAQDSDNLHLLLADGTGSFNDNSISLPGSAHAPFAVIDGDFDEDGDTDLLVALGTTDDSMAVYHNDGTGNLSLHGDPITPCPTNYDLTAVASGDFNADSITDVIVVCMGFDGTDIMRFVPGDGTDGRGNGKFSTSYIDFTFSDTCSSPNFLASGDFNGDAAADVAVSCLGSNKVEILLGHKYNGFADGSFSHTAWLDTDYSPNHITVADLDADGILDLAVTCDYVDVNDNHHSFLDVFRGNGDGSFAEKLSYPAPAGAERVAAGRINADAVLDLVVISSAAGVVSVYFGGGTCYP